jgi:hypothetical protein
MADKVASDVLAIIKKEPALAQFLRDHQHLTKDQWRTLSRNLARAKKKNTVASGPPWPTSSRGSSGY